MKLRTTLLLLGIFLLSSSKVFASGPFTLPFNGDYAVNAFMDLDDRIDWVSDYAHPTPWQESIDGWSLGEAYDGHTGTDYNLSSGTEVIAAQKGIVATTTNGHSNTYPGGPVIPGNMVVISHDDYETRYYHLLTDSIVVSTSSDIVRGKHIADSGNTGYSSGDHLHFEVRENGVSVDPYTDELWATDLPYLSTEDIYSQLDFSTIDSDICTHSCFEFSGQSRHKQTFSSPVAISNATTTSLYVRYYFYQPIAWLRQYTNQWHASLASGAGEPMSGDNVECWFAIATSQELSDLQNADEPMLFEQELTPNTGNTECTFDITDPLTFNLNTGNFNNSMASYTSGTDNDIFLHLVR